MVDGHHLAVVLSRQYRISLAADVDALVHAAKLGAVAIIGRDAVALARHDVVGNVDHFTVRYFLILERVDAARIPSLGVDVDFGLDVLDQVDEGVLLNQLDLVGALGLRRQQLLVGLRVWIAGFDGLGLRSGCDHCQHQRST